MEEEVYIKNPDSQDFTIPFDHKGEGVRHYVIKGLQMAKFPIQVAEHIKKHLADKLFQKRGLKNYPESIKKIHEEIERTV